MIVWNIVFYISTFIMLVTALALLFVRQPMHGAVYLIVSLIALAIDFYLLGSPLIAALQVILYVGAIMMLYVFFIMMNPLEKRSRAYQSPLLIPLLLLTVLIAEIVYLLYLTDLPLNKDIPVTMIKPEVLGMALFGHYKIAVEVVSTLLLAALIAVMYLAHPLVRRRKEK